MLAFRNPVPPHKQMEDRESSGWKFHAQGGCICVVTLPNGVILNMHPSGTESSNLPKPGHGPTRCTPRNMGGGGEFKPDFDIIAGSFLHLQNLVCLLTLRTFILSASRDHRETGAC